MNDVRHAIFCAGLTDRFADSADTDGAIRNTAVQKHPLNLRLKSEPRRFAYQPALFFHTHCRKGAAPRATT